MKFMPRPERGLGAGVIVLRISWRPACSNGPVSASNHTAGIHTWALLLYIAIHISISAHFHSLRAGSKCCHSLTQKTMERRGGVATCDRRGRNGNDGGTPPSPPNPGKGPGNLAQERQRVPQPEGIVQIAMQPIHCSLLCWTKESVGPRKNSKSMFPEFRLLHDHAELAGKQTRMDRLARTPQADLQIHKGGTQWVTPVPQITMCIQVPGLKLCKKIGLRRVWSRQHEAGVGASGMRTGYCSRRLMMMLE